MEGLVFTRISFAYFGGKRKEEGTLTTEDTERMEEEGERVQHRVSRGSAEGTEKKRWCIVCCLGPSTARPDAPSSGGEEKIGPLRSPRIRSGQAG